MLQAPAWQEVTDPMERIFSLLASYPQLIVGTDWPYGRSTRGLALAIDDADPAARERLAADLRGWTDAVLECLLEPGLGLPDALDRGNLAEFMMSTMLGALIQARTFRDVSCLDRGTQELRNHLDMLLYGRTGVSFPVRQALADFGNT